MDPPSKETRKRKRRKALQPPASTTVQQQSRKWGADAVNLLKKLSSSRWTLAKCVSPDCSCRHFTAAGPSSVTCSCSHSPAAHCLTANEQDSKSDTEAGFCQLFACIRNARALGDAGLSFNSQGLDHHTWGCAWFLSPVPLSFIQRALRLSFAGVFDPQALQQCLERAAQAMEGNAITGAVPHALPRDHLYQHLGMAVAAELDLAYWLLYYSALTHSSCRILKGERSTCLPSPETYFTSLTHNPPTSEQVASSVPTGVLSALEADFDLQLNDLMPRFSDANPLLAVLLGSWLELEVRAEVSKWLGNIPLEPSKYEGTMRGSDPMLPQPLRMHCDSIRDWSARIMAFAVPNKNAMAVLGRYTHLIEMGAGLGYWKKCYHDASQRSTSDCYAAYDCTPVGAAMAPNEYHGSSPPWATVMKGGAEKIQQPSKPSSSSSSSGSAVVLCYPPPDNSFALQVLQKTADQGMDLIYIGELGGDTGTPEFEAALLSGGWVMREQVSLPCYGNTASNLMVFRKSGGVPSQWLKCSRPGCTGGGDALKMCRLTRSARYCSLECFQADRPSHRVLAGLRHLSAIKVLFQSPKHFKLQALVGSQIVGGAKGTKGTKGSGKRKKKRRRK